MDKIELKDIQELITRYIEQNKGEVNIIFSAFEFDNKANVKNDTLVLFGVGSCLKETLKLLKEEVKENTDTDGFCMV